MNEDRTVVIGKIVAH